MVTVGKCTGKRYAYATDCGFCGAERKNTGLERGTVRFPGGTALFRQGNDIAVADVEEDAAIPYSWDGLHGDAQPDCTAAIGCR